MKRAIVFGGLLLATTWVVAEDSPYGESLPPSFSALPPASNPADCPNGECPSPAPAVPVTIAPGNPYVYPGAIAGYPPAAMYAVQPAPVDQTEANTILEENPDLVPVLLEAAADGDEEEIALLFFGLGPGVIEQLTKAYVDGDVKTRKAAGAAMGFACLHEDAPRSKVVGALLAAHKKHAADAEDRPDTAELLAFVLQTTRPRFRATMRQAIEMQLGGNVDVNDFVEPAQPFRTHGGIIQYLPPQSEPAPSTAAVEPVSSF